MDSKHQSIHASCLFRPVAASPAELNCCEQFSQPFLEKFNDSYQSSFKKARGILDAVGFLAYTNGGSKVYELAFVDFISAFNTIPAYESLKGFQA